MTKKQKAGFQILALVVVLFAANSMINNLKSMTGAEFRAMFAKSELIEVYNSKNSTHSEAWSPCGLKVVQCEGEEVSITHTAIFTAYNSVPGQTDDTPCISANGTNICEYDGCAVAQNGVPFGTKIEIDGLDNVITVSFRKTKGVYPEIAKVIPKTPPKMTIKFAPDLLIKAITALKGETVTMELHEWNEPIILKTDRKTAIVMPCS